jgi:hypothetical protein
VEGQFPYRAPLQLKRCKLLYSQGVGMAAGADFGIWFGMLSHAPYQARAFTRRMRGVRPGRDRQLSTLLRGFGGRLERSSAAAVSGRGAGTIRSVQC